MNSQEALKILGLDQNSNPSKDDIQAAFRKMAKKHHPDRNKDDPKAEEKFKEINSAYQLLNNPQPNHGFSQQQSGFNVNIQDIFNQFRHQQNQTPQTISSVSISFAESVLGVERELDVDQNLPCNNCNGNGSISLADNCNYCKGMGHKAANFSRGNVQFVEPCNHCGGSGKNQIDCSSCNGNGFTSRNAKIHVRIPGGVTSNVVLRIPGTLLKINVESDPDMVLVNADVVSNIEISLLDALKGVSKKVRTIKGEMNLKIPNNVKNLDSLTVHGYGVRGGGNHIFNVRVNYPENDKIEKIIKLLEE